MEKKKAKENKKSHICPHEGCGSAFNRPYRLTQHLLVHSNIKAFACPEENCTKAYTNKSHLDRHINRTHRKIEREEVVYPCPICFKKYANRQNLKRHLNSTHLNSFICDICKEEFKKKHQLSAHMFQHTGVKAFSCDFCEMKFVYLGEKKRHHASHQTHKCPHCRVRFNHWTRYLKHLKEKHLMKREFSCEECGQGFMGKMQLKRHMKSHVQNTSQKIFPCPFENCSRVYSRNNNLKQHIEMRHEMIKYKCHICEAQLSTKYKLREHIWRRHVAEPKVRVYKTKAMGRKVRKDFGTTKSSTVRKLASIISSKLDPTPPSETLPTTNDSQIISTVFKLASMASNLKQIQSSQAQSKDNDLQKSSSDQLACPPNKETDQQAAQTPQTNFDCTKSAAFLMLVDLQNKFESAGLLRRPSNSECLGTSAVPRSVSEKNLPSENLLGNSECSKLSSVSAPDQPSNIEPGEVPPDDTRPTNSDCADIDTPVNLVIKEEIFNICRKFC